MATYRVARIDAAGAAPMDTVFDVQREPPRHALAARQRGFSLLELLVTLIVIVLVTSMVSFNVGSGGQDLLLQAQVNDLADVASYALDEAQVTGVDFGLLLEEEEQAGETVHSYRWLQRQLDGWGDPQSGKEVFASRQLPPGILLELELEDAPPVALSRDDDRETITQPQLVFYASGETAPGSLAVRQAQDGALLWRLQWDLLGRIDVLRRGEAVDEDD